MCSFSISLWFKKPDSWSQSLAEKMEPGSTKQIGYWETAKWGEKKGKRRKGGKEGGGERGENGEWEGDVWGRLPGEGRKRRGKDTSQSKSLYVDCRPLFVEPIQGQKSCTKVF